jgi:hypothetical protein
MEPKYPCALMTTKLGTSGSGYKIFTVFFTGILKELTCPAATQAGVRGRKFTNLLGSRESTTNLLE